MPRRPTSRRARVAVAASVILLTGCGSSSDDKARPVDPIHPQLQREITSAVAAAQARPNDPQPRVALAMAHFRAAGMSVDATGTYDAIGIGHLRRAAQAWERYLALDPELPNVRAAKLMTLAYGERGLDDPVKALHAHELVVAHTRPPTRLQFMQLAQLAYAAGQPRTGDLAAARAIRLSPRSERAKLRPLFEKLKQARPRRPPPG